MVNGMQITLESYPTRSSIEQMGHHSRILLLRSKFEYGQNRISVCVGKIAQ